MNNELKYIFQGCLWVIVFFITASLINFCFSYKEKDNNVPSTVVIDNDAAINPALYEGRSLYLTNCASCHGINRKLVGPALNGVAERVPDKKLLYEWIRNNKKILQSGNGYFNALYNEYNKMQMTAFPNLTDEQIDKILVYVSSKNIQHSLPIPMVINN
jgi:mono/diheme cytochrome c family protein